MKVVVAPKEEYSVETYNLPKVFLAGGITDCPDWQKDFIKKLKSNFDEHSNFVLYNPRRNTFKDTPEEADRQITWEFDKLKKSNIIVFWFSRGSINPIVLYELGMWCNSRETSYSRLGFRQCVIGIDPEYERKQDVIIQTKLAQNGKVRIVNNLDDLSYETAKLIGSMNLP